MEKCLDETILGRSLRVWPHEKVRDWYRCVGWRGSNCYRSIVDKVLVFIREGSTVICIVPRGIHVKSAMGVLVIAFWCRASHGLWLDSSNEIGVPQIWYNCDNGLGGGVRFRATLFKFEGNCLWSVLVMMSIGSIRWVLFLKLVDRRR